MGERLLYDDEQGLEIVKDSMVELGRFKGRPVTAGEVASFIVEGVEDREDHVDKIHVDRVRTLLNRLEKQGWVFKEKGRYYL